MIKLPSSGANLPRLSIKLSKLSYDTPSPIPSKFKNFRKIEKKEKKTHFWWPHNVGLVQNYYDEKNPSTCRELQSWSHSQYITIEVCFWWMHSCSVHSKKRAMIFSRSAQPEIENHKRVLFRTGAEEIGSFFLLTSLWNWANNFSNSSHVSRVWAI